MKNSFITFVSIIFFNSLFSRYSISNNIKSDGISLFIEFSKTILNKHFSVCLHPHSLVGSIDLFNKRISDINCRDYNIHKGK